MAATLNEEDIRMIVQAMTPVIEAKIAEENAKKDAADEAVDDESVEDDNELASEEAADDEPTDMDEKQKTNYSDEESEDEDDDKGDDQKGETLSRYRKETNELRTLYRKTRLENKRLTGELVSVNQRVGDLEQRERRVTRYSKLVDLADDGFLIDPEEEATDTLSLDDKAFGKHIERIRTKYSRVPLNGSTYVRTTQHKPREGKSEGDDLETRKKYSKQARQRVERARANNQVLSHEEALEQVRAEAASAKE